MQICLSGAQAFLAYLDGHSALREVLNHPAYQRVAQHCHKFGGYSLTPDQVEHALRGEPTPFYGLTNLGDRLRRLSDFMETIADHATDWAETADAVLQRLLPQEALRGIVVYPIIGYDIGIGIDEAVCMNINSLKYLDNPTEFLYYLIHEAFHVVYDRRHTIPLLEQMSTRADWLWVLHTMLQNEGYAVYAPLALRQERGDMADPDYQVLADAVSLDEHIQAFHQAHAWLEQGAQLDILERVEALESIFGPKRLCYRVGCELIRRIEASYGYTAVQEGVYLDGNDYWQKYGHLLDA